MTNFTKYVLWGLYGFLAVVFFMYVQFPSERVRDYLLSSTVITEWDIALNTDKVKPIFPPGLKLLPASISHKASVWLSLDQLTVTPSLLSIFRSNRTFHVAGKAYGGSLNSRIDINTSNDVRQVHAATTLSAIGIQNHEALNNLLGRKISGTLSGNLEYDAVNPKTKKLDAKLTLSDSQIEAMYPLFSIKQFDFDYIQAELAASNTQVRVKECSFKGRQVNGRFSGMIILRQPLNKSMINLTGRLHPSETFLSDIKKNFPLSLFDSYRQAQNGIPVRIGGTLEQPTVSLTG